MPPHNMPLRQALTRSVAEECGAARAVRYSTTEYAAFQIADNGRTYEIEWPLDILPTSLGDAKAQAVTLRSFSHKQHLVIRETGERGVKLHVFAVKRKSAARYVHANHITRRVNELYLAPVCTIDGSVL